jgi:hypothetical protein
MSEANEIKRHRLLARKSWGCHLDGRVQLECGHVVTAEQAEAWKTRMCVRNPDAWLWCYCQFCAASPHSVTNPDAWAAMTNKAAA